MHSVSAVTLVGPVSPQDVADLLSGEDRRRARAVPGYRGIPTSSLAEALVRAGVTVDVVSCAEDVDEVTSFEGDRFRLRLCPRRGRARDRAHDLFASERRGLLRLIESSEAAVVHAQWTYEFAWAACSSGRTVLVTAHDAPLTVLAHAHDVYRAVRAVMAMVVRTKVRDLTVVSPYLAQRWRREMLFRRPIRVIPNIAPVLAPNAGIRKGKAPLLLDVSDGSNRKNVTKLIQAFWLLRREGRALNLALVGPGLGVDDPLFRRAAMCGDISGISWLGPLSRRELASWYRSANLFVHSSREESFGLSVVEAMACGLPVIAGCKAGAIPWLLEEGRAGVLVDVENPEDIASSIRALLEDAHIARKLARRAEERVRSSFSPEAVSSAYLDAYEHAQSRVAA